MATLKGMADIMIKNVEFPGPPRPAEDGGIVFKATVDGQPVDCYFTEEALWDINRATDRSISAEALFEASKSKLLAIAKRKIRAGQTRDGKVWITNEDI